jgi:hypothetical protein
MITLKGCVKKIQQAGDTVACVEMVVAEEPVGDLSSFVLVKSLGRRVLETRRDADVCRSLGADGPENQVTSILPCRGAACQPAVEITLADGLKIQALGSQPGQEADRCLDAAAGEHRLASGDGLATGVLAQASQVGPGGKCLDSVAIGEICNGSDSSGDPSLCRDQLFVTLWQGACSDEDGPKVFDRLVRPGVE